MVNYFLSFLIVLLLLTISWTDLTKRVINNKAVIALFFLIVPFSYFFYGNIFVLNGIVALIVGFVLFQFGIFGGGEDGFIAKLQAQFKSLTTTVGTAGEKLTTTP